MRVTTFLGLLIVAIVIVVVIVGIHRDWFALPAPPELGDPLARVAGDNVGELVITAEGKPQIRLQFRDGQWRMLAPIRGRADDERVQRVIRAVLDMRMAKAFSPSDPKRPSIKTTALDTPRAIVRVVSRGGDAQTFRIGAHPAWVEDTYVQEEGVNDIFLARPDPTKELTRPFIEYRVAELIEFDRSRLRGLTVIGRHTFVLSRPANRWLIAADGAAAAATEAQRVGAFLAALEALQITGVIPAPATELEAFGLAPPAVTLTFGLAPLPNSRQATGDSADPTGPNAIHVALGSRDGVVYAMLEGHPWLMTIDPEAFENLIPAPNSLRDRRVLPVQPNAIRRIGIQRGGVTTTIARQGDRWAAVDGSPVATGAIDRLLADLTEPRVTDFVSRYSTLAGFGLDAPRMRITCTGRDGATYTILVGDADSRQRVYVKREGDRTVMMVHAPELAAATAEP